MNIYKPIYTDKTDCQDCYKCIRACPTKSIIAKNNIAMINSEACVYCGECVRVCPAGAKKTRNDVEKAKALLKKKKKVFVSLAPSYAAEFYGVNYKTLVKAFKELGFAGVSETALGAEILNLNLCEYLNKVKNNNKIIISTSCPAVNELIRIYFPHFIEYMAPFLSPALTHAKFLKSYYGDDIGVVFVGPCPAKKLEAEANEVLDAALTFDNVRKWFEKQGISLENSFASNDYKFEPFEAKHARLYPSDGGTVKSLRKLYEKLYNDDFDRDFETFNISGLNNVKIALERLDAGKINKTIFVEALACKGGCINGPSLSNQDSDLVKNVAVVNYADDSKNDLRESIFKDFQINITCEYSPKNLPTKQLSEDAIVKALNSIGKFSEKDELNCGGCGYDSCKDLAKAIAQEFAEPNMCVSYNRKLATKKANALMNSIPAGVVIVDADLRIIECNYNFASLMGEDTLMVYEAKPGLEGASLKKIFSGWQLFQHAIETGEDIIEKELRVDDTIFLLTIFSIEKNKTIGAILRDVTEPSIQKEQIVKKANEVIKKNLATVQKIAFLLGENAAETEVILNSIIESFSNSKPKKDDRRFE